MIFVFFSLVSAISSLVVLLSPSWAKGQTDFFAYELIFRKLLESLRFFNVINAKVYNCHEILMLVAFVEIIFWERSGSSSIRWRRGSTDVSHNSVGLSCHIAYQLGSSWKTVSHQVCSQRTIKIWRRCRFAFSLRLLHLEVLIKFSNWQNQKSLAVESWWGPRLSCVSENRKIFVEYKESEFYNFL